MFEGRLIATFGRQCLAIDQYQQVWRCHFKGRDWSAAVNDRVQLMAAGLPGEDGLPIASIESIEARRSLFWREDLFKRKLIAANIDCVLFVVAVDPPFSTELISRAWAAAQSQGIALKILLNKVDLPGVEAARTRLVPFVRLGVEVIECSAKPKPEETRQTLLPKLQGLAVLLAGQSGMGKSTVVNVLAPEADARTRDISHALNSGRHTTTFARAYGLGRGSGQGPGQRPDPEVDPYTSGVLIDSPGFQQFGLAYLSAEDLERSFADLNPAGEACQFANCRHLSEPGCAVTKAVAEGRAHGDRYQHYCVLRALLDASESDRHALNQADLKSDALQSAIRQRPARDTRPQKTKRDRRRWEVDDDR